MILVDEVRCDEILGQGETPKTMCFPSCAFRRSISVTASPWTTCAGATLPRRLAQRIGEDELGQCVQAVGDDLLVRRRRWPEVHEQLIGPSPQRIVSTLSRNSSWSLSENWSASLAGKKSNVPSLSTAAIRATTIPRGSTFSSFAHLPLNAAPLQATRSPSLALVRERVMLVGHDPASAVPSQSDGQAQPVVSGSFRKLGLSSRPQQGQA